MAYPMAMPMGPGMPTAMPTAMPGPGMVTVTGRLLQHLTSLYCQLQPLNHFTRQGGHGFLVFKDVEGKAILMEFGLESRKWRV